MPSSKLSRVPSLFSLTVIFMATGAASLQGCSSEASDPSSFSDDESEDDVEVVTSAAVAACTGGSGATPGRWQLPVSLESTAAVQRVPIIAYGYGDPATSCVNGRPATRLARGVRAEVLAAFPGAFGTRLGCDNLGAAVKVCRPTASGNSTSPHAAGRAIDIFVPPDLVSINPATGRKFVVDSSSDDGTNASNTQGDVIANWLVENAERLHIQRVIWDRSTWSSESRTTRYYSYSASHNNHVHVEVTPDECELPTSTTCTRIPARYRQTQ